MQNWTRKDPHSKCTFFYLNTDEQTTSQGMEEFTVQLTSSPWRKAKRIVVNVDLLGYIAFVSGCSPASFTWTSRVSLHAYPRPGLTVKNIFRLWTLSVYFDLWTQMDPQGFSLFSVTWRMLSSKVVLGSFIAKVRKWVQKSDSSYGINKIKINGHRCMMNWFFCQKFALKCLKFKHQISFNDIDISKGNDTVIYFKRIYMSILCNCILWYHFQDNK